MPNLFSEAFSNFSGGEASIYPAGVMEAKNSRLLENLYIKKDGVIGVVKGYKPIHSNAVLNTLDNGICYYKNGVKQTFVSGQGKIYRLVNNTLQLSYTIWSSYPPSEIPKIYFEQMGDYLLAMNGDTVCAYYDGGTWYGKEGFTLLENFTPTKPFIHKNRLWTINSQNRREAGYSALNNPLEVEGYLDFKSVLPSYDELIDIKGYLDFICFIFKNYVLVYGGTTPGGEGVDFYLFQIIPVSGISSADGNLFIDNNLFFITASGIKALDVIYPSNKITVNNFSLPNDTDIMQAVKDNESGIYGVIYNQEFNWLQFLIGDKIFIYNRTYGAWSRIKFPSNKSQINGFFRNKEGEQYCVTGGHLHLFGNDDKFNGDDIIPIWQTAWLTMHKYAPASFPKFCDLMVQSALESTIEVQATLFDRGAVAFDYAAGEFGITCDVGKQKSVMDDDQSYPYDEGFELDSTSPQYIRIPLDNCGKYIRFTFIGKGEVKGLEFSGLVLYFAAGRK